MIGIYQIRNTRNGKLYIGQSVDLMHRKNCHWYDLNNNRHKNIHLQRAYNVEPDALVFEVICQCSEQELNGLEIYFIKKYKTTNSKYGYNLDSGGNGAGRMSEETKAKLSKAKKGNTVMCGKKLSDEWKKHLSEAQPHKRKIKCIETGIVYESFAEAARQTGLNRTKIVSCCTGKRKSTGGFHFEYADKETSS